MVTLTTAICLHAQSADLKFLNPVGNRMAKLLGSRLKTCRLTDQKSHADGVLELRQASENFVVIFAHGSGDYLRGGEYRSRMTGENVEIEKFLKREDLSAFNGKVIFCMSCDSNGLAQASLEAGAIAFVGFDDIPFNRFDAAGEPIGSRVLVKHSQELIAEAFQAALERFLVGRASLEESIDYLRLFIAKKAAIYVRQMGSKSGKECKEIAALFLKVRAGVRYHGQRGIYFDRNG